MQVVVRVMATVTQAATEGIMAAEAVRAAETEATEARLVVTAAATAATMVSVTRTRKAADDYHPMAFARMQQQDGRSRMMADHA